MAQITIKLDKKDLDLLQRIAASEHRRFSDFCQLVFAEGVEFFFSDQGVAIKRAPDEYTKEERQQQAKNEELEKQEGFHQLSFEERRAKGWDPVSAWLKGNELLDPIVERIKARAIAD